MCTAHCAGRSALHTVQAEVKGGGGQGRKGTGETGGWVGKDIESGGRGEGVQE